MFFSKKSFFLILGDTSIILAAFFLSSLIRLGSKNLPAIEPENVLLLLLSYLFTFYIVDFYNSEVDFKRPKYLVRHISGSVAATSVLASIFYLFPEVKEGRTIFLLTAVLAGAGTYFWRWVFQFIFQSNLLTQQKLLIIGAGRAGTTLYRIVKQHPDYEVIGIMTDQGFPAWGMSDIPTLNGDLATLNQLIREQSVNVIVLAISNLKDSELLKAALDCKLCGVSVYDMPTFYEIATGKVPVEHVTDFWLVFTPLLGVKKNIYNLRMKRAADLLLSLVGLIFTLPLNLIIAAAIKLDSAGPVLFRQTRVGLNGERFTILKFRSMKLGTDHEREFAGEKDDPRITRVGKILRMFRMDEIPQMWNVLKGDMSFIGPRALIEDEVREFEEKIPYFSLRHSVRPGISGWAQVKYPHGVKVEDGLEKLQYDLFYVKNLSPLLDLQILLLTVKVVLSRKGAR